MYWNVIENSIKSAIHCIDTLYGKSTTARVELHELGTDYPESGIRAN